MKKDKKIIWLFVLSVMGVAFSGYLSGVKLFTKTCAFNESCPYFWGYPACYFGFGLFFTLFVVSSLLFAQKIENKNGLISMSFVSFLGVLFAGYFTLKEIPILLRDGLSAYLFGLPTCALGLVFFIVIFITSLIGASKKDLVEQSFQD
jgi:uncharacterized membrane protein